MAIPLRHDWGKETTVGILCGGSKEERELSLQGGQCIFDALQRKGYANSRLIHLAVDPDIRKDELFAALGSIDVAIVCLHGAFGEDGVVQGLCEALRVPYSFSGPFCGTVGCDKIMSKRYLAGCGIITPVPGGVISTNDPLPSDESLPVKYPLMLKDPTLGCSKGVWKCDKREDLVRSLKMCKSPQVLLEKFVIGTDIVCCCLERADGSVTVWPVIEFDMDPARFQDLASKNTLWGWAGGNGEDNAPPLQVTKRCPATKISQSICEKAQKQARDIFKEMNASGALNVEFRVELSESGREEDASMYFIEMSVVPALTNLSVHAVCAKAGGMEYDDLVESWLKTARLKSIE